MYEYRASVLNAHDGDTLRLEVDLGIDVKVRITARLAHLNAPELATPTGKAALAFVVAWLADHAPDGRVTVDTIKDHREKYGRYLAVIHAVDGTASLNDDLLAAGHAVPYEGGAR